MPETMEKNDFSGLNVIFISELDSTNNYANGLLKEKNTPEGTVVLTFRQFNGKGHGRNSWESEDGKNLTFSMILYPSFLPPSQQFVLSQAISLGIAGFMKSTTGNVSVKWPNDILINGKKAAGILIENTVSGNFLQSSVIGIGLNLNQREFPDHLPHATSLALETGREYRPDLSLKAVLKETGNWYQYLKDGHHEEIKKHYLSLLYRSGIKSIFRADKKEFEATITGIDEYGQLLLEEPGGITKAWPFKTIEMVFHRPDE